MKPFSRRDLLKSSLLAPAAIATQPLTSLGVALPDPDAAAPLSIQQSDNSASGAGRERLLLDFGWRFHFGHASDPAKDFGYANGRSGSF